METAGGSTARRDRRAARHPGADNRRALHARGRACWPGRAACGLIGAGMSIGWRATQRCPPAAPTGGPARHRPQHSRRRRRRCACSSGGQFSPIALPRRPVFGPDRPEDAPRQQWSRRPRRRLADSSEQACTVNLAPTCLPRRECSGRRGERWTGRARLSRGRSCGLRRERRGGRRGEEEVPQAAPAGLGAQLLGASGASEVRVRRAPRSQSSSADRPASSRGSIASAILSKPSPTVWPARKR